MTREKAKQKAVKAIRTIVEAAKELAEAEAAYYRPNKKQKQGAKNDKSR